MIPVLFDHFATDFTTNGLGRLDEAISCTVKEIINSEYELEMQYPISGKLFQRMVTYGGIICATHDHNLDVQPFDIYRYSAPINGIVTFYAHHISYRLSNLICTSFKEEVPVALAGPTPEIFFEHIPPLAVTENQFSFEDYSGYTPGYAYVQYDGYVSIRDAFLNGHRVDDPLTGSEALYKVFPGEFMWDNFTVKYYRKRGSNNGVQIRYGKNMSDVTRERDTSNLVSSVFPFWIGNTTAPGGQEARTLVFGDQAFSPYCEVNYAEWNSATDQMETENGEPYFFGAADSRAAVVDFSQEFQEEPTKAQLKQAALDWMSKNSTWRATDNITVKFVDAAEYEGLEDCSLGDYVNIYYVALGIVSENVEIVSLTYNVLADSVTEMELGQIKTTFAAVLEKTLDGGLKA